MKGWQEYMMFYGDNSIDIDEYACSGSYMSFDDFIGFGGMNSDEDDLIGSHSSESQRLRKEADSGNNEVQRLIRKICAQIERPSTLWRSKATPDKNLAECEDCKNKAVQCICEDEWCLDKKNECKAFKRHSECCMKTYAEKVGHNFFSNKEKNRQLAQSYHAKRETLLVAKPSEGGTDKSTL